MEGQKQDKAEVIRYIRERLPELAKESDEDILNYAKAKGFQVNDVDPSLLASRKAASASEFEQNKPDFNKPATGFWGGVKQVLDAPLDFGAGVEKVLGLDPMHPIASLPGAARGAVEGLGNLEGMNGLGPMVDTVKSIYGAPARAVQAGGQAIRNQDPSGMFQAVGEGYGATKPLVETARGAVGAAAPVVKPQISADLMARATKARARAQKPNPGWGDDAIALTSGTTLGGVVGGPVGAAVGGALAEGANLARQSKPYLNAKAGAYERAARFIDPETAARYKQVSSADQYSPMEAPTPDASATEVVSEKLNIPRPGLTPDQRALLVQPPADVPPQNNVRAEQAVLSRAGTVNNYQRQAMGRLAPQLLNVVPEVKGLPPGPSFDTALMKGFKRVEANVDAASKTVPKDTKVSKIELTTALSDIVDEYEQLGNPKLANIAIKELAELEKLPEQIPWEEFVARKRAFFKDNPANNAAARRTYGAYIEIANRYGNDFLRQANNEYSVVRSALDLAKIDPVTGRRIAEIGKVDKARQLRSR